MIINDWAQKVRPVLINTWEAFYFSFTQETLLERLVPRAVDMGMDLLVVDDGWFGSNSTGSMRNDDSCCLGDWYHNPAKLPAGLSGLTKEVNAAGLNLGIWMEPEMVGGWVGCSCPNAKRKNEKRKT